MSGTMESPQSPSPQSPFRIRRYGSPSKLRKHPVFFSSEEGAAPRSAARGVPVAEEEEEVAVEPEPSILLHQGNKLFWRINRTIDFRVYLGESSGSLVVRSFDSVANV